MLGAIAEYLGVTVSLEAVATALGISTVALSAGLIALGTLGVALGVAWVVKRLQSSNTTLHTDLKSEVSLKAFYGSLGGSSQGTLAFVELNGIYYMIEQETTFKVNEEATHRAIVYLPQKRMSHFHAESRIVKALGDQGIPMAGAKIWVSKPICMRCADLLRSKGFSIQTSEDGSWYEAWVSPDEVLIEMQPQRPVTRFIARSDEETRLKRDQEGLGLENLGASRSTRNPNPLYA